MLHNNKIQIAMLEVSDQNRAVLEFYFDSIGEDFYDLVTIEQAEVFISDYDYSGSKADIERVLENNHKPIVLISTEEQNIPSTIWLKQPFSAAALTVTSEKIKQMISDLADREAEIIKGTTASPSANIEPVAIVLTEESSLKEVTLEASANEETTEEVTQQEPQQEPQQDLVEIENLESNKESEEEDVFELLDEAKESKSSDQLELTQEQSDTVNLAKLEFADVDIDVQSDNANLTKVPMSEVDALLESLITDSNEDIATSSEAVTNAKDEAHDLFLENLDPELEQELEQEEKLEGSLEKNVVNKEIILEPDIAEEKEIADLTGFVDKDLVSKLDEESENGIDHEDKDIIIEESFTLHDDQNPSQEAVYTDTLLVDYTDLNTEEEQSSSSLIDDKLVVIEDLPQALSEQIDESTQEEVISTDIGVEENLESDSFDLELELELEPNPTESEVTPSLGQIEIEDNNIEDQNSDSVNADVENIDHHLKEDGDVNIENDLDILLKEVVIKDVSEKNDVTNLAIDSSNESPDEPSDSIDKLLEVSNTSNIDEDFTNPSETSSVDNDSPDFELQLLLNEVRQEAGKGGIDSNYDADGKYSEANAYKKTEAEKRWVQLCGDISNISQQKEVDKISFIFKNHLLNSLLEHLESSKDSENLFRMKYKDLIIVIDHSKNKIYCNIPTTNDDYAAVCFSEIDPEDIKIHDLDYSEIRLYRKKIKENTNRAHSIESFIWTTSLLTSQGRLPKGTEIKKTISLKVWPDLTRVELIPHAMNIAAVLSKQPGSLLEIPKRLDIPQRYVFAFYNAALALNMIELDSNSHNASSLFSKKATNKKSEEKGVFGRLFKRSK